MCLEGLTKNRGIFMHLNIAVCDDSKNELAKITEQVHMACSEMNITAHIWPYQSGEELLASDAARKCEIIFMDIYLGGMNGMETARIVAPASAQSIVFITTSTDHAIEAFNLNAAHYLVKPTSIESVSEAIRRCISSAPDEGVLEIKMGTFTVPVPIKDILYIEVVDKYCAVHTDKNTFQIRSSLALIYKQLDDKLFMKPQQSYIINMAAIEKFYYDHVILRGGTNIMLSRKNRAALKEQYQSYLFRLAREGSI